MNELTIINKNGILFIDSREVAKATGMRHDNLLRKITKYVKTLENAKLRFQDFWR
jgi:phage regulator Rha-like protein